MTAPEYKMPHPLPLRQPQNNHLAPKVPAAPCERRNAALLALRGDQEASRLVVEQTAPLQSLASLHAMQFHHHPKADASRETKGNHQGQRPHNTGATVHSAASMTLCHSQSCSSLLRPCTPLHAVMPNAAGATAGSASAAAVAAAAEAATSSATVFVQARQTAALRLPARVS